MPQYGQYSSCKQFTKMQFIFTPQKWIKRVKKKTNSWIASFIHIIWVCVDRYIIGYDNIIYIGCSTVNDVI